MRDESEILPLVPPPDRLLQPHVGAPRRHDLPPLKTTRITTSPTTKSRAYQEEAARTRMKKLLCSASGSTCSWFWSQPAIYLKNSAISFQENLAAMCVCVCCRTDAEAEPGGVVGGAGGVGGGEVDELGRLDVLVEHAVVLLLLLLLAVVLRSPRHVALRARDLHDHLAVRWWGEDWIWGRCVLLQLGQWNF